MKRLFFLLAMVAPITLAGCDDALSDKSHEPLTETAWTETFTSEDDGTVKVELFFTTPTDVVIRVTTGLGGAALALTHSSKYSYNPPLITLNLDGQTIFGTVDRRKGEMVFDESDPEAPVSEDDDVLFLVFKESNDADWTDIERAK